MSKQGGGKTSTVSNGHTALGGGVCFDGGCVAELLRGCLAVLLGIRTVLTGCAAPWTNISFVELEDDAMKYVLIVLLSVVWINSALAQPFELQCKAKKGVGYRLDADANGVVLNEGWTDEGSFDSAWSFKYPGSGDLLTIDGKGAFAFFVNDTVIAIEYAENGMAQSVWTYAINILNMEAVATQVNASNVLGPSLKGRTVSLSCHII